MSNQSSSVAEAARLLGVSGPTVKRMAEDGKLDGFRTPGGHLRVTKESLDRLRESGSSESPRKPEPSTMLRNRREHLEVLNLEAHEMRAQRELAKLRQEAAQEAERDREERLRQDQKQRRAEELSRQQQETREREQEEAERVRWESEQRHIWENRWTEYALKAMPRDCPKEYEIDVAMAVSKILEHLNADQPDYLIKRLVEAALEKGLQTWRRAKATKDAIRAGEACLPLWIRSLNFGFGEPTPTEWQVKVRCLANEKIARLGDGASLDEIRAAAMEAGQAVAKEHEAAEAAIQRKRDEESAQQRQQIKLNWGLAHISGYLRKLEDDGDFDFEDRDQLKRKLEKLLRPKLFNEIQNDAGLQLDDVEDLVEDLVDEFLPEFTGDN